MSLPALALASAFGPAMTSRVVVAQAPTRPFVVVANQESGVATLVELASGRVSHVKLGAKPHEVAVSPDARVALLTVPSEGFFSGRKVLVMDLASASIARTIELRGYKDPHGVAFLSDSVALIGTLGGTSALFVDVRGGRILRVVDRLPENPYIVKLASTGRAYVSSPHSSKVTEIDVAGARVLRALSIPEGPAGIAVSGDGKELYAAVWTERTGGGIAIVDIQKGTVTVKLPATEPRRITVTPDGKTIVVSDRDDVHIIDRTTRQARSVAVGQDVGGSGVACSPDSTRCYIPLSQSGEIVEVELAVARVLRRFRAERGVDGIAYVP